MPVRESAHDWIVDSGATSYICNSKELFEDLRPLSKPQKVTLDDGHTNWYRSESETTCWRV